MAKVQFYKTGHKQQSHLTAELALTTRIRILKPRHWCLRASLRSGSPAALVSIMDPLKPSTAVGQQLPHRTRRVSLEL